MRSDPRTADEQAPADDASVLTAHALDQLSAEERAAIDARLADPAAHEARAHVAAVRRLARALRESHAADTGFRSSDLRRAVIAACAARSQRSGTPTARARFGGRARTMRALLVGGGLAAAVALVAVNALDPFGRLESRQVAQLERAAGPHRAAAAGRAVDRSGIDAQAGLREANRTAGSDRQLLERGVEAEQAGAVPQEAQRHGVRAPAAGAVAKAAPERRERRMQSLGEAAPMPPATDLPRTSPPGLGVAPPRLRESRDSFLEDSGRERYAAVAEAGFLTAADHPLSTFSVDVDTASYALVRRFLEAGHLPPRDAVRIEEMMNYFRYDTPQPDGAEPFAVTVEATDCPWRDGRQLVRIALQGRDVDRRHRPAGNIVFLIDVSGSMREDDKLPLVQQSLAMLVEELTENDTITIVTYAGDAGLRLPPTTGDRKDVISAAIASLTAGGSTHGSAGIALAYELAAQRHIAGGVNRVILATDGDLNVGVTSTAALVDLVRGKARAGTFLTVLGFGTGNLQDAMLEQIADHGNGIYAYIDGVREARKVLVEQLTGSTITIAKDVKIQVEFNPARVSSYRLLGYENRALAATDFRDDRRDAGDIGAGHGVTALYEIVPTGAAGDAGAEPLKYGRPAAPPSPTDRTDAATPDELLTVKLRYKQPDGDTSVLREVPLDAGRRAFSAASQDLRFAAAVAAFGMILRDSEHRGDATLPLVAEIAGAALGADVGGYRAEFLDLVRRAKSLRETGPAR